MSKIDGRTKEMAASQIDESLKRLKVDHVDLLQHHEVIRFDDPDRIFAEGGAMEAVVAAKQAGKVRFIGYTGHKDPRIHLYMLEVARPARIPFRYRADAHQHHGRAFPQLRTTGGAAGHEATDIAVLGMKCFGGGVILKSGAVAAGGLPQLLAECAGVGADHGNQFAHAAQPGVRGGKEFQADG